MTLHSSPPADFPIYGLTDAAWDGPRWLRFYEAASGEVPFGIHLAHGRSNDLFHDRGAWAEVRSLPRTRFEHGERDGHGDSVRDVARYAWMSRGFGSAELLGDLAETEASAYQEWSTADWALHGGVVQARVVPNDPHARGAWAAFTETQEVFVVVVARGIRPDDIQLTRVLDGSIYGMSLDAMLDFPGSIERSIANALGSVAGH